MLTPKGKDAYEEIYKIERELRQLKTLYGVGGISYKEVKTKIKTLSVILNSLLNELPEDERNFYNLRKEFKSIEYIG
ncbi:MAG: hypothetical protein V1802_02340 [Candidatus Aenigmatarchaeota archaeon]